MIKLKIIGFITILGVLLGCEANELQKDSLKIGEISTELLEATQDTIAVMENSDGVIMDTIYLGEGVFAFFHPETKEFQSGSINSLETKSFNPKNQEEVDEYMLQTIKKLYGENSTQFQSLKNQVTN